MRRNTFVPWSQGRVLRQMLIRRQLEEQLAAGAVQCAECCRIFTDLGDYTHDSKGRPVCYPNCGGGANV
jgi:hypothetical protein